MLKQVSWLFDAVNHTKCDRPFVAAAVPAIQQDCRIRCQYDVAQKQLTYSRWVSPAWQLIQRFRFP